MTGFDLDDGIAKGPLMDLDVVRLLQARFVVLRWRKGMGAPFEDQDVFGMGPGTFGSGMLVVRPDGTVVRELFVLDGTAVYDVLLDALDAFPETRRRRSNQKREEQVAGLLGSGQLAQAEALLNESSETTDVALEAYLRAELHRLRRAGDEGLRALGEALRALDAEVEPRPALRNLCHANQVRILTGTGAFAAAEAILDDLLQSPALDDNELRADLLFQKGALRLQVKDRAGAEDAWSTLIDDHGNSRWSWLAAAGMGSPFWTMDLSPNLEWPKREHRRLITLPEPMKRTRGKVDLDGMIRSAAAYLIDAQQADGSWITTSAYGDNRPLGDDFDFAATAIGGRALLRLTGQAQARAAAQRALDWLHARRKLLGELEAPPVVFMDYAVWSRSYGIFFLADCMKEELGDAAEVRTLLALYVEDLLARQQPNGGWSYYLSGKAGAEATPQSISFTTASCVLALQRAASVGVDVPKRALNRGLDCLEAMRSPHGTFAYFLNGRSVKTGERASDGIEASAARGPVCALALIRGARESEKELGPRLEMYVEHLGTFGAQQRKALMHAGLHSEGSHYLLYDYSTAAEALRDVVGRGVTGPLAKRARAATLEQLVASQNQNGSYVDNPLIGADAGTGLALSCLLDLKD